MIYEVLIVSTIDNMITGLALMIKCSKHDREIDESSSCNSIRNPEMISWLDYPKYETSYNFIPKTFCKTKRTNLFF